MMHRMTLLVLSFAAVGCNRSSEVSCRSTDTTDVYEAMFRQCLRGTDPREVRFLAVDNGDVPADVLDRLRRDWPNIQPASIEPKEKGWRIYVKGLRWVDRNTVELRAGYWFPTKHAGEGGFADYQVLRGVDGWVVQQIGNKTMS